ncbi:MAG: helix-turn-helix domain-containing protein [Labilithrix sp.]|nr:helix-turn-helix domain-containing protein [Labilithrix sp.]
MPAADAAALLGIKRETLYAYASRGRIRSVAGSGADRARLYCREDLERQRGRGAGRGRGTVPSPRARSAGPKLSGPRDAGGHDRRDRSGLPRPLRDRPRPRGRELRIVAALFVGPGPSPARGTPNSARPRPRALAESSSVRARRSIRRDVGGGRGARRSKAARKSRPSRESSAPGTARPAPRRVVRALPRRAEAVAAALAATPASSRGPRAERRARRSGVARGPLREAPAAPAGARRRARARGARGARTTRASVEAMNVALVLCADHELNASTFAARVAASSGASLTASIVAALAALSGPLHGAATARVEALVAEIERPERAAEVVAARLGRGEAIPGYGHPLYPDGDPRGAHLLEIAGRLSSKARAVRVLVAVTNAMHLVAREAPTVDVGLAALASALGLRRGAAIAVFACGRLAGWIAHALEQREGGHLLRPRARYVGA